jgi:hypothetical protein
MGAITGFQAENYIGVPIENISLNEIWEPWRYRHPSRIKKYLTMLQEGKEAPPIELILLIPKDVEKTLKKPYDIFEWSAPI